MPTMKAAARHLALKDALDRVRATVDREAARSRDPVSFVHRYPAPEDQEIVGLLAAAVAFGQVVTIRQKLGDALDRLATLDPSPARAADDEAAVHRVLRGWQHRVYRGEEVARLVVGARKVQREAGSLGAHFARAWEATGGDLRETLALFCDAIRTAGGLPAPGSARPGDRRGAAHLVPDPRAGSGTKRLHLYLRWMIRPADGIDLGLWPLAPSILVCPVDTHIHKLSRNLGFTRRNDVSFRTAREITAALARFDPADPVKYDFSLCHLGMLQRCPSRRDPARCEGCGVQPVCRFWTVRARATRIKEVGRKGSGGPRALRGIIVDDPHDGRQEA
jgi:uncharacterized protein (TIGR02757 family)